MNNLLITMNLAEVRSFVFKNKPNLGRLYNKYKDTTWIQYGLENYNNKPLANNKNTDELIRVFKKILVPLVGQRKADRAAHTLRTTGFVSTADHSGILCHPFFLNSTLLRTHPIFQTDTVITFSCGGISLSNSSYPRGIFYHNSHLSRIRVPLISLADRHLPVYGHTPITQTVLTKHTELFKPFLDSNIIWKQKTLGDQFTIMNSLLMESVINIEVEELVKQLLIDIHLSNPTQISSILFNSEVTHKYIESFDGVIGAHSRKSKGSHIFWYINKADKSRMQLWYDQTTSSLISKDRTIRISLKPHVIRRYLLSYELMPTMAFCYSVLAFYYGLTLGGGFSQIHYLDEMKNAYRKTFGSLENVRTDVFTGEFVTVGLSNGIDSVPASLFDILMWGGNNAILNAVMLIDKITVGDSLDAMLPEFASIIDKHIVCRQVPNTKLAHVAIAATTPSITPYIASRTEWSVSGNRSRL